MGNCKVTSQVLVNAASRAGVKGVAALREVIKSADDVREVLTNPSNANIIGTTEENNKERLILNSALQAIPKFKRFGLLLGNALVGSDLLNNTNTFISSIVTNKTEVVGALSSISNGRFTVMDNGDFAIRDGRISSSRTLGSINAELNKMFQTDRVQYVIGTNSNMQLTNKLTKTINNYHYDSYLENVAGFSITRESHSTEEFNEHPEDIHNFDYDNGVAEMISSPTIANIQGQRRAIFKEIADKKKSGNYTTQEMTALVAEANDLQAKINEFKISMTPSRFLEYINSVLNTIASTLNSGIPLTADLIVSYTSTLDLISNAGIVGDKNMSLLAIEYQDPQLMYDINIAKGVADGLLDTLQTANLNFVKESVEDKFLLNIDMKTIKTVYGLAGTMAREGANWLGVHTINNPVIQFLEVITNEAIMEANRSARVVNEKISDLFKNVDTTAVFYQRDSKGLLQGRMTDVFSSVYWSKKREYQYNGAKRRKFMHALNPMTLFETDTTTKKYIDYVQELEDDLGSYKAEKYIAEAQRKWSIYKTSRRAFLDTSPTQAEQDAWTAENSPIYRLNNTHGSPMKGSDSNLVVIPKRTVNGKLSILFDANYDIIRSDAASMELYESISETFLQANLLINRFSESLKPPKIGFLPKTTTELLKAGDLAGAAVATRDKITMKYGKEALSLRAPGVDPISGRVMPVLEQDLHSVEDEIKRVFVAAREKSTELANLDPNHADYTRLKKGILDKLKAEAAKEVEESMTMDLMQSVAMANYSLYLLVNKSKIESTVRIARRLIEDGVIQVDANSDNDHFKAARKTLEEQVENFLDRHFYSISKAEKGDALNLDKNVNADNVDDDIQEGLTTTPLANGLTYITRLIGLGWSLSTAIGNIGQGQVSNIIKGLQGNYYTMSDYSEGMFAMANSKNRKLIDLLYVIGEVAHQNEKRSIHVGNESFIEKWGHPLKLQTAAEVVNQGTVAMAILHATKITDQNGVQSTLLKEINEEGFLSDSWSNADGRNGMELVSWIVVTRIRAANRQASGDYISPLKKDSGLIGRLMLVFKKFLPEMILDRYGSRRMIYSENRQTEGTIRAFTQTLYEGGKNLKNGGKFLDGMDDTRLAHAKFGLQETILIASMFLTHMLLGKLLCTTKECKNQAPVVIYLLNMLNKLSRDALMVAGGGVTSFIKSPYASMTVIENFLAFGYQLGLYTTGSEDALYKTNTVHGLKGEAKFKTPGGKLLPLYGGSYLRMKSMWEAAK